MTKKKESLRVEDRFFINLNEDISLDVDYEGFTFTLTVPELLVEATVSLGSLRMAQRLLRMPEYSSLLESIKLPKLEMLEEDGKTEEVTVGETSLDLNKIQHIRYALNFFPDEFISTVNNIAYLNLAVSSITFNGKEVWIKVDDEEVLVDSFEQFITHIRTKRIRFGRLVDALIGAYRDWLDAIEVTPQEVKN